MMQSQMSFTVDQDESKKTESAACKFWCCQCSRNDINDVSGINNDHNNLSVSNGVVVTRQPLSTNNESNFVHNDLNFSSHVSENKNVSKERKHESDDDTEMNIKMERLKEESTNITSILLDNLISESDKVDPTDEMTKNEQKETKNSPRKQDSVGSACKMEDIVLSDPDEENLWESIPINEHVTRTDDDQKERAVHHNIHCTTNYDGKKELEGINDVSDASINSASQTEGPEIRLKDSEFPKNVVKVSISDENIDTFSKSINSSNNFISPKRSVSSAESDRLSIITIPYDDLLIKEESIQSADIEKEIGHKNLSVSEYGNEAFVRRNKMYTDDVSSSSSSDNGEIPEIIISTENPEITLNVSEKSGRTDFLTRKYTTKTKDEDESDNDEPIIKSESVPKNDDNLKKFKMIY